ncbi:hypothetical protein [Pseudomonas sp. LFM046]|uniref:hypothetical protein n=1 Tax=Pseudomonas sp. LFM046 TaxID=1608357 RepID=UPI0005CF966C|nr:hypothetical protein [Pseudomonas sp. LFM046]
MCKAECLLRKAVEQNDQLRFQVETLQRRLDEEEQARHKAEAEVAKLNGYIDQDTKCIEQLKQAWSWCNGELEQLQEKSLLSEVQANIMVDRIQDLAKERDELLQAMEFANAVFIELGIFKVEE